MDEATADIYEQIAVEWAYRRGGPSDDLGARFRQRVGTGLIADLGCGAGRYLDQLGEPVIGLDVASGMLSLAAGRGHRLVRGEVERLPLADASLAGLFARHSYLHVPKAAFEAALADAHRVLRPGGLLMMSLIGGSYEGRALPGDDFPGRFFACWNPDELRTVAVALDFAEIDVSRIELADDHFDVILTARRWGLT